MEMNTPNVPPPNDALWKVADVAHYLGMSLSWVRQRVAAGTIPCLRVGGWAVRFDPEVVRAWAHEAIRPEGRILPLTTRIGHAP